MEYLTYADYQAMGGALAEAAFDRYQARAAGRITEMTHGRITAESPVRAAVKSLAFEIVELLRNVDAAAMPGITSYGNGSVSATFASDATVNAKISALAADLLASEVTADDDEIPLLYAGVWI